MFITLTNATESHRDNKIVINSDHIVTVYSGANAAKKVDGVIDKITYIFCPPHGTWEVQETLEEVANLLNDK